MEVKTQGFRELDAALAELKPATAKNAMRGAAKDSLQPMLARAKSLAPDAPPLGVGLVDALRISSQLSPRAAGFYRREGPAEVRMHMGPVSKGTGRYAGYVVMEFGGVRWVAQPYMRPAWDAEKMATLNRLKVHLEERIMKAAARAARKALKA